MSADSYMLLITAEEMGGKQQVSVDLTHADECGVFVPGARRKVG